MKKFGLIGKKLGHSYSKSFFEHYFLEKEIDATYDNLEIAEIDEVEAILNGDYHGINVTLPYKEQIIPYLDELDEVAEEIGSVNVVKIDHGKCIGYNSDAYGFQQMIKPFLTNKHEKAIVFGTGGASKSIIYVLEHLGIEVLSVSRAPKAGQFSYGQLNDLMIQSCKLIVNTTPVGMFPKMDEELPVDLSALTPDHLVVDLIYNPRETKLLQRANLAGAITLNGESMLREQALKAWEIWDHL